MVKIRLTLFVAGFDVDRLEAGRRLEAELRPQCVTEDVELDVRIEGTRRGGNAPWNEALRDAVDSDATHLVTLPDDAILVPHYVRVMRELVEAKPDAIICGLSNHAMARGAHESGARWYTTPDGFLGFSGALPVAMLREYIPWRDAHLRADYPGDSAFALWAMRHGHATHKPLPSPAQHDVSLGSLVGNEWQDASPRTRVIREAQVFDQDADMRGVDWAGGTVADMPKTLSHVVWDLVRELPPPQWDLDAMYRAAAWPRMGDARRVVIVVPVYREQEEILRKTRPSRDAVAEDLERHGIECIIMHPPGDSHVDRMRQRATHAALKMGATHVLWWDADIEAINPTCVRAMLGTDHDVVAGACPFKDDSGRVVCNLYADTEESLRMDGARIDFERGCVEVQDAGTGFMLVSRDALLRMMHRHHGRLFLSRGKGDEGEPLWAIWDASLTGREGGDWRETVASRGFQTEDYFFCRLWQLMGGAVYVFVPATFRHWGLHGYEASFVDQWGLSESA